MSLKIVQHLSPSDYGIPKICDARLCDIVSHVNHLLDLATTSLKSYISASDVKGILVPHGKYDVAGLAMASSYANLLDDDTRLQKIKNVILLLPRQPYDVSGIVVPQLDTMTYCHKQFKINKIFITETTRPKYCQLDNEEFMTTDVLELQMPFIFHLFNSNPHLTLLPMIVGNLSDVHTFDLAKILIKIPDSLFVIVSNVDETFNYNYDYISKPNHLNFYKIKKQHHNNVLSLWSYIAFKLDLIGKITNHYTKYHMTKLHMTQSYKSYKINYDIMFQLFDTDTDNDVFYLSMVFLNHKTFLEYHISRYLTDYEKMGLLYYIRRIIADINKYSLPDQTVSDLLDIANKTHKPVHATVYDMKIPCFILLETPSSTRGYMGSIKKDVELLNNIIMYTVNSGFNNIRTFSPIKNEDLRHLSIGIYILKSPVLLSEKTKSIDADDTFGNKSLINFWKMGQEGIMIYDTFTQNSKLFFKDYPVIHNLTAEETMKHLCLQASINQYEWLKNSVSIYVFEDHAIKITF